MLHYSNNNRLFLKFSKLTTQNVHEMMKSRRIYKLNRPLAATYITIARIVIRN